MHLRFGRVARGGIRWSDRREDFRTEILGLVKAQQVKNAVIVPVGAKGGFYPKQMPANPTREQFRRPASPPTRPSSTRCSTSPTIWIADGQVVPPPEVLRHDGDDPYLVVAADKGTATFSDIANGIAQGARLLAGRCLRLRRQPSATTTRRWASPRAAPGKRSSAISANWARDIQNEPISPSSASATCRAMCSATACCCRKHTRLVAAFDHRHIFLDPNPDAATSLAERKRLFDLPRSSWDDYDKSADLQGRRRLRPHAEGNPALAGDEGADRQRQGRQLSPPELIKALLKAEIDLLWFGGIGTYIKASTQTNLDVGDRANDAVRVNGSEIRAKVVGEGANLGVTQLGRIEYARSGGRIDTDAIDNSAGVDTSDHEVNLKILLGGPLRRGETDRGQARRNCWPAMTDDVAAHVLADNYDQTLALSVARARGGARPRRPWPLHARPGTARQARPRGGIPAQRRAAADAGQGRQGPHPARTLRCCWPMPSSIWTRRSWPAPARRSALRMPAGRLFPARRGRTLFRRSRSAIA